MLVNLINILYNHVTMFPVFISKFSDFFCTVFFNAVKFSDEKL